MRVCIDGEARALGFRGADEVREIVLPSPIFPKMEELAELLAGEPAFLDALVVHGVRFALLQVRDEAVQDHGSR